mgnify:CR=1 FL=1
MLDRRKGLVGRTANGLCWAIAGNQLWVLTLERLELVTLGIGTAGVVTYMPPGGLSGKPYATLMGAPIIETEWNATLGTVGDIILEAAVAPVSGRDFRLKVNATPEHFTFSYAEADGEWKHLGTALPNLIATEVAGVWSGVLLGPYSSGNGSVCANPADVDYFEYRNEGN